ncbi:MAG: HAD-IA family hydrolase [Treponema sp.]|nr:HAD-IA family hydrolase [Treponema sp.]
MLFIFDMGGVVTSTFKIDSIFEKLHLSRQDFYQICKLNNNDIWHKLEIGQTDVNSFWKEFNLRVEVLQRENADNILSLGHPEIECKEVENIPQVKNDLFRLYFHPQLNEKTVELIKALKNKHRVVCGTNTIQSHWENHLERGDYTYFDQTYASNKIGLAKPDPDFFKLILEAEGYKAQDAFFVDDKEENCRAAASLGIQTKRMESPEDLYKEWIKYSE